MAIVKKFAALILVLALSASVCVSAAESATWSTLTWTGDTMLINMVQGDYAADLIVSGVIDYEFIDNTASVPEFFELVFYDDGLVSMEFANVHYITVQNEGFITFLGFEYNDMEAVQVNFYMFGDPTVTDKVSYKYDGLYWNALRPGWAFYFADNYVKSDDLFLLYNRAAEGDKAEAFIFHVFDKKTDATPVIEKTPIFANSNQGSEPNTIGREPVSNFYGEIESNGHMSFDIPGTEYTYIKDPALTYSLFITEDGTQSVDYWVWHEGSASEYSDTTDIAFYEYAPVWSGVDVAFEITDTIELTGEPLTYGTSVSGFFLTAGSLNAKDGEYSNANYLVGIVLSYAQIDEYRETGTIEAYPEFDWSVLGGEINNTQTAPQTAPQTGERGNVLLWLVIGGVAVGFSRYIRCRLSGKICMKV